MSNRIRAARGVFVAPKLYEIRDTAKSLLERQYDEHMRECRAVIEAVERRCGLSTLAVATKICEELGEDGHFQSICVIAAALEMLESSDSQQDHSHA